MPSAGFVVPAASRRMVVATRSDTQQSHKECGFESVRSKHTPRGNSAYFDIFSGARAAEHQPRAQHEASSSAPTRSRKADRAACWKTFSRFRSARMLPATFRRATFGQDVVRAR